MKLFLRTLSSTRAVLALLSQAVSVAVVLGLFAASPVASVKAETTPTFRTSSLTIAGAQGRFQFDIEIAETDAQRTQGLQHRTTLPSTAGMLFDFRPVQIVVMWMKNTRVPLDMVFLSADGRIVTVAENTTPYSLSPISSGVPVAAVLEVNAGTVRRLGLKAGDRVIHPLFSGG